MCLSMLCLNVKRINKTSLFVWRIVCAAVAGLDGWSRLQIIDSV